MCNTKHLLSDLQNIDNGLKEKFRDPACQILFNFGTQSPDFYQAIQFFNLFQAMRVTLTTKYLNYINFHFHCYEIKLMFY